MRFQQIAFARKKIVPQENIVTIYHFVMLCKKQGKCGSFYVAIKGTNYTPSKQA